VSTEAPRGAISPIRCTTADGLALAAYDFGGVGPDLLLVHATGLCAAPFLPLARSLGPDVHCSGVDLRAHGHSERPADGNLAWAGFTLDVLATVDGLGLEQPVGVGHSCGGAALLLAEQARPGTFHSLYLFEPVVFPGEPSVPVPEENPMSAAARRRRETFPSAEDAFVTFSSKPPLDVLDPEALCLYVEHGFERIPADEGGDGSAVRLRCRRDDEAETFARAPSNGAFAHLAAVRCPVTLAYGQETDAFGRPLMEALAGALPDAAIESFPGLGHFGPLEQPGVVAAAVHRSLDSADGTPSS
jgi:pimeloyl-ACP methyl ester carboxylesterase